MSNISRKEFLTNSALGLAGSALGPQGQSVDTEYTNPAKPFNNQFTNGTIHSDQEVLEAANQNIEKYRKGDVAVRLLEQDGKPLTNLPVDVKLQQHHFKFGDNNVAMARYTEDFMTVAFGHPAIKDFYFWGVMGDAVKWEGEVSPSHNLRPVYDTVYNLIQNKWSTEERLTTDSDGYLRFRGFYGDYSVRYQVPYNQDMEIGNRFSVVSGQSMPLEIKTVVNQ